MDGNGISNNIKIIPHIKNNSKQESDTEHYWFYNYIFPNSNKKDDDDYADVETYIKYFEERYKKYKIGQIDKQLSISHIAKKYMVGRTHEELSNYFKHANDVIDFNNLSQIVTFPRSKFLNIVFETYKNDADIVRQFSADFPRQDIYINNNKCNSIDELFLKLSIHNKTIRIDNMTSSIMMLILVFLCQSSFYISFRHIHDLLVRMKTNFVERYNVDLSEGDNQILDYHLTDTLKREKIDIIINENMLCCSFLANYKIIDITRERTITNIMAETIFDIDNDECIIIYETIV